MKEKEEKTKEKELKLSFLQKVNISIINFEHYYLIAADGWKRAITYLLKLLLLFSLVLTCIVTYKASMSLQAVNYYAKNELPDCGITNNQFWIKSNDPVIIENKASVKIILDDKNSVNDYIDDIRDEKKSIIVISKDNIYFKSSYAGEMNYSIEKLSTLLGTNSFTKEDLIEILSNNSLYMTIFIYSFIGIYIMYFVSMIIDILALAFVGYLISRSIGLPLKFSATYGMATSAMSLPILLTLIYLIVNLMTGFYMTYFQVMITIVSYIYMVASIIIMRSNLLNGKSDEKEKLKNDSLRHNNNETEKADEE